MFEHLNIILDYIDSHLYEDISLNDLSDYVKYSKSHLSREFNRIIGLSVSEYITKRRLSNASIMIFETDKPINYVSDYHGFNSVNYFSTLFKKELGISPREYRRNGTHIYLYPKRKLKGGIIKQMKKLDDIVYEININEYNEKEIAIQIDNVEVNGEEVTASVQANADGTITVTLEK